MESEVIDVDIDGVEEAFLLGRLVTAENWNPSHLIEAMKKVWKPKHGMSAREWGQKLILFRFDDSIDRDWALKHQPWHFEGFLFAIKKFTGGNEQRPSSSINVAIDHASFWTRLYDVPISCMNERSLRLFVEQIGGLLESVDKADEDSSGKFVRFKMYMNITKPLVTGITIRMKGEVLGLPLKYESLPVYCFCCGTIGHSHKNCESSDSKYGSSLEASPLKWRICHSEKPATLPHDIIENILSRLPVKYLLRLKAVSKQWKDTISDPRFAEIHLQQSKNSCSRSLLAWESEDYGGFYVAKLQNNCFRFVSAIKHPWEGYLLNGIVCYCDGLFLCKGGYNKDNTYLLWNPSSRTYKKFQYPYPIDDRYTCNDALYGSCYDPLVKDYKVVIGDMIHYAVFSCKNNKWSEMKEMKVFCFTDEVSSSGVSFNGSYYWILQNYRRVGKVVEFELICFDWRDEKIKELPMPDCKDKADYFNMTSLGGHLRLFVYSPSCSQRNEMKMMKKLGHEDSWVEFKVEVHMPFPCDIFVQLCLICSINENEIILFDASRMTINYILYDERKNTFAEVEKSRSRKYVNPVPYLENLFCV